MFGTKLNAAFQISHPKIGRFLLSMPVGSKFQILLGFLFEREAAWSKASHRSFFLWHWRVAECVGQNWKQLSKSAPPKIGKFLSSRRRGSKFQILLLSFAWKVNWLSQKTFTGVSFCHTEGSWNVCAKTECCFPNQPSQNWSISLEDATRVQISNFIEFFVWKVSSLKESFPQEFFFVTLKGCGMCWPKLKAAFQISRPKIGKFLSSRQRGSKFQILLLYFVWKVSWLSQKTFTGVSFCDTKGSWNVWAKPESSFPNQAPQNWSISFEQAKRVQTSNFIAFFCLKGKLAEPKTLHRSFILSHWRVVECLGQNWMLLSKSATPKLVNFLGACQ